MFKWKWWLIWKTQESQLKSKLIELYKLVKIYRKIHTVKWGRGDGISLTANNSIKCLHINLL